MRPAVTSPASESGQSSGSARARLRGGFWPATGSVTAVTLLIGLHGSLYGRWIVDDAGITFAYARSIATGAGPVLQPGVEPVEGYSNPAWLALLVLGRLLGLFDHGTLFGVPDYVVYPKALALLCCAGIAVAFHAAARPLVRWPSLVTLVAGGVLAAIPSFVIWTFSGLENSLYALAVVVLAVVVIRAVLGGRLLTGRVAILTALLAVLAALTRPDGLIYVAAYPLVVAMLVTRPVLRASASRVALSVGVFVVLYGAFVAWRYALFGQLLPTTAVAKGQSLPRIADLGRATDLITYAGWLAVIVAVACLAYQLAHPSRVRTALSVATVPLVLALVAYCVLPDDWMVQYRFATPVWALGALVGTLAVWTTFGVARVRGRVGLALAVVVAVVVSGLQLTDSARTFRAEPTVPLCIVADRYGRLFNAYADVLGLQHASMLLPDVGGTALTSRLTVYDSPGLVSPEFAQYRADDDMAGLRDYVFTELKPGFIHTHGWWGEMSGIPGDPRLARDYHRIVRHPEGPRSQDWVRKDLVSGPAALARLRAYADRAVDAVIASYESAPLRSCGATLRRGQTPPQAAPPAPPLR